jgi:hypothetical protein
MFNSQEVREMLQEDSCKIVLETCGHFVRHLMETETFVTKFNKMAYLWEEIWCEEERLVICSKIVFYMLYCL